MDIAIIAIYGIIGYMLTEMNYGWDTIQFWCILMLMVMLANASRILTTDHIIEGMIAAAEEHAANEGTNE